MYSPLTKAAEGGGVGVGVAEVGLGTGGVGVLGVPKREAQADKPKARVRINIRLPKFFLIRSSRRVLQETSEVLFKKRGLKNIVRIIPTKNPSPTLRGERGWDEGDLVVHATHAARRHGRGLILLRQVGDQHIGREDHRGNG